MLVISNLLIGGGTPGRSSRRLTSDQSKTPMKALSRKRAASLVHGRGTRLSPLFGRLHHVGRTSDEGRARSGSEKKHSI